MFTITNNRVLNIYNKLKKLLKHIKIQNVICICSVICKTMMSCVTLDLVITIICLTSLNIFLNIVHLNIFDWYIVYVVKIDKLLELIIIVIIIITFIVIIVLYIIIVIIIMIHITMWFVPSCMSNNLFLSSSSTCSSCRLSLPSI